MSSAAWCAARIVVWRSRRASPSRYHGREVDVTLRGGQQVVLRRANEGVCGQGKRGSVGAPALRCSVASSFVRSKSHPKSKLSPELSSPSVPKRLTFPQNRPPKDIAVCRNENPGVHRILQSNVDSGRVCATAHSWCHSLRLSESTQARQAAI